MLHDKRENPHNEAEVKVSSPQERHREVSEKFTNWVEWTIALLVCGVTISMPISFLRILHSYLPADEPTIERQLIQHPRFR